MRFLVIYLGALVAGSAIVYFGTPPAAAKVVELRNYLRGTPSTMASANTTVKVADGERLSNENSPRPISQTVLSGADSLNRPNSETGKHKTGSHSQSISAGVQPGAVPTLYRPPAATLTDGYWGVVLRNVEYTDLGGNRLGEVNAGSVVEIERLVAAADGGGKAVALIDINGVWQGPVLLPLADLVRFAGSIGKAPPQAVDLLHRYYHLKGQITERRAQIKQQMRNANPHAAPYREALQQLKQFDAKVGALVKERDTATGERRSQLIDELHGMKIEMTRLQLKVEELAASYKEWSRNNRQPATAPADPELEGWVAELASLESAKNRYIY